MTGRDAHLLGETLRRWDFLQECLLYDVRPVVFGFGVDLVFNLVRPDGHVRADVLDRPELVTFRLLGVESISFVGGLTDAMRAAPEKINWGLSEVSRVEQIEVAPRLGLSVRWEGPRRLDIEFLSFEVLVG